MSSASVDTGTVSLSALTILPSAFVWLRAAVCFRLFLLALLKTAQLAKKVTKLTRSSRVLAADMAATTKGVKGMMSRRSISVTVLGTAGR